MNLIPSAYIIDEQINVGTEDSPDIRNFRDQIFIPVETAMDSTPEELNNIVTDMDQERIDNYVESVSTQPITEE